MPLLIAGTLVISPDEPCFGIAEVNLQSGLPGVGWRRYQIGYVVRQDKLAEFRRDLGPLDAFKCSQFRIPGGVIDGHTGKGEILHTVGELMDIADKLRAGQLGESSKVKPDDLLGKAIREAEEVQKRKRHVTTSGPHITIQRSA